MQSHVKLGVIAGGGDLPRKLAEGASALGREVFILGVKGFVGDWIQAYEHIVLSIGETGGQLKALKANGVVDLCFAGIVKRPDFSAIKLDSRGMRMLPRVIAAAAKGDDALMRTMLQLFEDEGFRIVGADDVLADLVLGDEVLGDLHPSDEDVNDIKKAAMVAGEIGKLDIGQGAVVCRGLVLAVEAQEGTDAMLERCAELPISIRGNESQRSGVLVKRPKPQQERRIDLPTIGKETVRRVANAGLAGIAVEAGGALVLEKDVVAREADRLGVWVVGRQFDQDGD